MGDEKNTPLPQEVIDKIFLYLDFETLSKTREIQSDYIQSITSYSTLCYAALNGNLANMKWILSYTTDYILDEYVIIDAAYNGNLCNIKWLHSIGCPWNEDTFNYAIINGNLENIKWLFYKGCPYNKEFGLIKAIRNQSLENMMWLISNGFIWTDYSIRLVKEIGSKEMIKLIC